MARVVKQYRVAFAKLRVPNLVKLEMDFTKDREDGSRVLAIPKPEWKGALAKIAVRYREEDVEWVERQVAAVTERVRADARHVFPVEKEVIRPTRSRDPAMRPRMDPLESFRRWMDLRGLNVERASLEAVFSNHLEKAGKWSEPLFASRFMVTSMEVTNYIPFDGPSCIGGLAEGVYGIIGSYTENNRRSNRAGKSALLKAVLTALFGDDRGEQMSRDIHHGREYYQLNFGLGFDDVRWADVDVMRKRTHDGKVSCGLDGAKCSVTSLNEQLAERLRFTKEDFTKIAFVKAGELHGIIGSGNSQMKADLMRWLGLEGWGKIHDSMKRELLQLDADLAHKQVVVKGWLDERFEQERELERLGDQESVEVAVRRARGRALELADRFAEKRAGLEVGRLKRERVELSEKLKKEVAPLEVDGELMPLSRLQVQVPETVAELRKEREGIKEKALSMRVISGKLVEQKERFLTDNICPLATIECPIADKVCFAVEASDREAKGSEIERSALRVMLAKCEDQLERAEKLDREVANRLARAKVFRARIEEIDARLEGKKEEQADGLEIELENAREKAQQAESDLICWRQTSERIQRLQVKLDETEAQNTRMAQRCALLRVVMMACGRDGIPTLQMENALSSVEVGANAVLQLANAPHRVAFSFQKELKRLEDECHGCGRPFDTSEKACKRCGTDRANKRSEDISLEVVDANGRTQDFSQDSSGGKALAALALRVALAQHFGFSVLFLDEVCASLDDENLDLMMRLLGRLREMGFDQVFVISHRQRVRDLLDKLIVVERDDALGRSKFFLQG